jgi:polysaccharide deacetylase family protein (PEP-CTERM system associated)
MKVLECLDQANTKATFFVLGWVGEKAPGLVREISKSGHEIASHGYEHKLIYDEKPQQFREDICRSKALLEDIVGAEVKGYRAPTFSITGQAIETLREVGFRYDSSFFPSVFHDRYGKLTQVDSERRNRITEIQPGFYEVPIPTLSVFRVRMPWGGGGYFRLLPYHVFRWGIRHILQSGEDFVFYFHPWEMDPKQPKVGQATWSNRFRQYNGLAATKRKLEALLRDFAFEPIGNRLERRMGKILIQERKRKDREVLWNIEPTKH